MSKVVESVRAAFDRVAGFRFLLPREDAQWPKIGHRRSDDGQSWQAFDRYAMATCQAFGPLPGSFWVMQAW